MCTFGVLGLSCATLGGPVWWGRRGFTRQPESPNVHILVFRRSKHTPKFNEKTPRETQKDRNGGGKGKKKSEILGGPAEGGPVEGVQWKDGPGKSKIATTTTQNKWGAEGPARSPKQGLGFGSLEDDCADVMRLKNTLSHEVHVTQKSQERRRLRALSACSQVVPLARVGVRVLVVDVVLCHACPHRSCCCSCCKYTVFRSQFSVVGDVLFTPPVGDSELR